MFIFQSRLVIANWRITIRTLRLCSIYRRHVNTWIFAKNCVERKAFSLCEVQSATKPRVHVPNSIALRAFALTFQVSMHQIYISLSLIFNLLGKKHGKSHRILRDFFVPREIRQIRKNLSGFGIFFYEKFSLMMLLYFVNNRQSAEVWIICISNIL